ncbi:MAG: leucine-rich repeat domain-containing protein, partial [Bacteroidota bacterium]|nr:leucine-rich repeat domain-containing protein [Bacteroidota bacterium]
MTDIQTIKQIEKELNIKLEKVDEIKYNTKKGYTLNEQAEIIELGLYECEIKDLNRIIDFLKDLKSLTTLNLRSNNISDISFLKDLKNLTTLDLSANEISDISVLKDMKSLTSLNLSFNQISDISVLKNLKNLTNLNLERNQITNISVLKELKNLIIFDGEHNMISNIKSLNSLSSLQQLYLSVNKISDISPLKYLRKLERVDLNSNKIKILPKWISNFSTMEIGLKSAKGHIGFGNNPLRTPPIEIVKQGKKAINNYFASLKIHNKELKLILLGNTTAGKTSLVQYLTEKKYPPKKTTHGIELTAVWQPKKIKKTFFNIFKKKKPLFSASIWDFGGQEYYHATHRLFLTNNSFYILLWDKNQNKTAILPTDIYTQKGILENKKLQHFHYEYWLKLIRKQFAPGAEIITVQNKTDISGNEIIAQQTVDNYKIKAQYQISIEETAKGTKKQKRKYTDFEEDLKDYITEFIKSQAP